MIRRTLALAVAAALVVAPAATSAAAPAQAPACEVAAAELTWGVKETFRAYIDGSIANGEWTVADGATYETPMFGFPAVTGSIDPRDPGGSIDFAGTVRFVGHGGILDTTIANPALVFRGGADALLLLDVSGPTMDGGEVAVTATPFVAVDLSGQNLTPVDGIVSILDAPTTLTGDGAEAFQNYPAGESFDPLSVTIDVGDCELTGQPIGTDVVGGDSMGNATLWIVLIVGAIVLLVAILVVLLVARLRR